MTLTFVLNNHVQNRQRTMALLGTPFFYLTDYILTPPQTRFHGGYIRDKVQMGSWVVHTLPGHLETGCKGI